MLFKSTFIRTSHLFHHVKYCAYVVGLGLPSTALLGCGSPLDVGTNANDAIAWGSTEFALTAELDGVTYALRDAEFTLNGPEEVLLRSNDYPDDTTLVQELQSGQYTLELLSGYRLVSVTSEGENEVEATLETPNPQTLLVAADQTTNVNMLFRVARQAVSFGRGSVAVGLAVEPTEEGGVLFSEFMVNPGAITDTQGEWLELMNTSSTDVDLNGCTVARDDSSFTISQTVIVPAGGFATLANGPSPGFAPTFEYSGFSLPNTAIFTLSITCNQLELDSVHFDPGSWPLGSGASTSLSPEFTTSTQNDDETAWCLANKSYGTDFGTPGEPNENCQG